MDTYAGRLQKLFRIRFYHIYKEIYQKLKSVQILVADGKRLNFLVINPFTGRPARAVLVGFLDWKSGYLVGYEIMLEENTQCIASALRMAIINLDMIPKIVYQDNGKAFKAKYFSNRQVLKKPGLTEYIKILE